MNENSKWRIGMGLAASVCLSVGITTVQAALVSYQPLDDLTGLTASGAGATITSSGGGLFGEAASFDSTTDYFTATSDDGSDESPITGTGARTVAAWVNLSGTNNAEYTAVDFGQNGNAPGGGKFGLQINPSVDSIEGAIAAGRSSTSGVGFTTGNWQFVAISAGSGEVAGDILAYLNGGTAITSGSNSRAINTVNGGNEGEHFRIGVSVNDSPVAQFEGLVDEVSVWDEQLTDDEIEGLYDVGNQLAYTADLFEQLKDVHDAGSGSVTIGSTQWSYATSLGATAGLTSPTTLVLDSGAGTGLTASIIPEPASLALLTAGAALIASRRRR